MCPFKVKKIIGSNFRKAAAGTLVFALVLFLSLCCCLPASRGHAMSMLAVAPMSSMPADVNAFPVPQHKETKAKFFLTDAHACQQCKCRNVITSLNEAKFKMANFNSLVFKAVDFKFLATDLSNGFNLNLRRAPHDLSPPQSIQHSVPIFLFIKVLRL